MSLSTTRLFAVLTLPLLGLLSSPSVSAEEVNLYSARKEKLIKPLLDRFTAETGIRVNLVTGKADALLKRLASEGRNSPADLLITTDAGRLHRARTAGVTQGFSSPLLEAAIPASFRDPEGHWYGLSLRARPIMYVGDRVSPEQLSTYKALAEPRWKGRICIRSSNNIYNQSLVVWWGTSPVHPGAVIATRSRRPQPDSATSPSPIPITWRACCNPGMRASVRRRRSWRSSGRISRDAAPT